MYSSPNRANVQFVAQSQKQAEYIVDILEGLYNIPKQEKRMIGQKFENLDGREGFAPNIYIFKKSKDMFIESSCIKENINAPAIPTQHTTFANILGFHASKDDKVVNLKRHVGNGSGLTASANFNGNKKAGQEGPARISKSRPTRDECPSLVARRHPFTTGFF